MKSLNTLAATLEESDEKCDKAGRVRDVIFVDSLADGDGFIWNCCYFSLYAELERKGVRIGSMGNEGCADIVSYSIHHTSDTDSFLEC